LSGKLKVIEGGRIAISEDVQTAVLHAIQEGYPFVMVARRPDGNWEVSRECGAIPVYEVIGALEDAQFVILNEFHEADDDADPS
jgi:hypothetical protein